MKLYSARRGHRGRARGGAALRRQRLHGRVRGRAARPRREGAADLRGHRRDPGRPDRARAARLSCASDVTGAGRAAAVALGAARSRAAPTSRRRRSRSAAISSRARCSTRTGAGLFPMRADGVLAWWSPDPRGVIPLDGFHVSRSLRPRSARFEIRVDTAFEAVMRACADPRRPHGWIDESFVARVHAPARDGLGAQRRGVAPTTRAGRAASTASGSAGCSRASRCSTA